MSEEKDDRKNPKEPPVKKNIRIGWLLLLASLLALPVLFPNLFSTAKEISWPDLERKVISRNAVEKIEVINQERAEIYIRPEFRNDSAFKDVLKPVNGRISPGPHYTLSIGSVETFDRKLEEAQKKYFNEDRIPVTYTKRTGWLLSILGWLLPLALLVFFWQYMFKRIDGTGGGSSLFNFGKSTATVLEKERTSDITFKNVAGLEEAAREVHEIIDFLKNPQEFTRLGAKIPKGVILVGPPGTGKTLLAKAVAGEARVPFFSISGSEFVEMFVGVGASRVRDLFKKAKEKAPCIIFIDEIDAIGRSRSRNALFSGANDERESTLNQLLTEMDGFGTNSGVIVLAATNRGDMLDPALLRPGRFDRHIYLELPNIPEREAIFKVHLSPLVLSNDVDPHFLAAQTPGFSGADIANICNESALIAARGKKEKVSRQDFIEAIDRIVAGLEKKSKIILPEEKKIIAYHEAGHALSSWLLRSVDPLSKVSIIPRGKSLGASWYLPEEKQLHTRVSFYERVCATLAGRAAEEIMFGGVSSGALDDLEKATKDTYAMVAYYGFSKKIGNVSFYDSTGQRENAFQKPYSEETARLIDEEVRKMITEAYEDAKTLLTKNRSLLMRLAQSLLEKEVLMKDDLERILGARPSLGKADTGDQSLTQTQAPGSPVSLTNA